MEEGGAETCVDLGCLCVYAIAFEGEVREEREMKRKRSYK